MVEFEPRPFEVVGVPVVPTRYGWEARPMWDSELWRRFATPALAARYARRVARCL